MLPLVTGWCKIGKGRDTGNLQLGEDYTLTCAGDKCAGRRSQLGWIADAFAAGEPFCWFDSFPGQHESTRFRGVFSNPSLRRAVAEGWSGRDRLPSQATGKLTTDSVLYSLGSVLVPRSQAKQGDLFVYSATFASKTFRTYSVDPDHIFITVRRISTWMLRVPSCTASSGMRQCHLPTGMDRRFQDRAVSGHGDK